MTKLFLLGLFVCALYINSTSAAEVSSLVEMSPNYCEGQFQGRALARGYGSEHANCGRAERMAESTALFTCYKAGHSKCEISFSRRIYSTYDSCEYEVITRSKYYSQCLPLDTYVGGAWAKNYGSEYSNCSQATRIAEDSALSVCYNSGARSCRVMYSHIARVEGATYCEAAAVVRRYY